MSSTITLTAEIKQAVEKFIEYHNPARASTLLRCMFMEALKNDLLRDELYFPDLAHDLDGLFELLGAMAGEAQLLSSERQ